tara:strand:+ start:803 stop:1189 length:387 start_codon:yes stop_codon:yes gene_type:complete
MLQVSIGIIKNSDDEILVSNREKKNIYNNHWEFPGGKLEDKELSEEALVRELYEELGIVPMQFIHIDNIKYHYTDYTVELIPFIIEKYSGVITNKEGQRLKWFSLEKLNQIKIIPASKAIIKYLLANN